MNLFLVKRHDLEDVTITVWALIVDRREARIMQWSDTDICQVYLPGNRSELTVDVPGFLAAQTKALEMIGN